MRSKVLFYLLIIVGASYTSCSKDEETTITSIEVEEVRLNQTTLELSKGEKGRLSATILPETLNNKSVTWITENKQIATVDEEGIVTAISIGQTIIAAKVDNKIANCKVTISAILVESITLDREELSIEIGKVEQLVATILPENADNKDITWTTENQDIITVDENGQVTALAEGETIVTAKAGNQIATCKVKVTAIPIESVRLDKNEISIETGEKTKLKATVLPENAGNKTITWIISDNTIATVDENGTVTGIAEGEAMLTAKAGEKTATCKIFVSQAEFMTINGIQAIIDLDIASYSYQVSAAIKEADQKGVVEYILKGNFEKLGIIEGSYHTCINPFQVAEGVETINFNEVNNWPNKDGMACLPDNAFSAIKESTGGDEPVYYQSLRKIILPETVQVIGDYAFRWCRFLKEINLTRIVTIGNGSFLNCKSLRELYLPSTLTIGIAAFKGCSDLERINIPNITVIKNETFWYCTLLETINLPKVESVGMLSFSNCNVKVLDLPEVREVDTSSFSQCEHLTTLKLPMLTNVGDFAFNSCKLLSEIKLPKLKICSQFSFSGCSNLETVELPELRTMGKGAFHGCSKLKNISLPKVIEVREFAFHGCLALSTIKFPQATWIEERAFSWCRNLKSIDLPKVTKISDKAFLDCISLTTLQLTAPEDIRILNLKYEGFTSSNCNLFLHVNNKSQVTGNVWKDYEWKSITFVY